MDGCGYWTKAVDEGAIFVPIGFELVLSLSEYPNDVVRGIAVVEVFCRGMAGKVYSGLLEIVVQCRIQNGLKSGGGQSR